jgi:hypothetical protein
MKTTTLFGVGLACVVFAQTACSQATQSHSPTPRFLADPYKSVGSSALVQDATALEKSTCKSFYTYMQNPTSVGELIGGAATSVRVVYVVDRNLSLLRQTHPIDLLKKVWNGRFNDASCFIGWSEGAMWSVEGTVRFVDGRERKLITDGSHVAFQDQTGRSWFVRLLPAAQ